MSDEPIEPTTHTRRRLLQGVAGGGTLAAVAGGLPLARALAKDGDEDNEDNSGRGGGDDHSGHGGGGDEADTVPVTGEIPAGSVEIRIVHDDAGAFQPGDLTVDLGQSVTFANAHDDVHTATGSGFDTGDIRPGGTATVVLEEAGRFRYACNYHPEMTGSIAVRDDTGVVPERTAVEVPADAATVSIANFAFVPASVAVPAGGTVVWTNDDSAPHTVTAEDGAFDSGVLDPGMTFSRTFDAAGAVAYRCDLHPAMTGTVAVGDGEATTDEANRPAAVADAGVVGAWTLALTPEDGAGLPPMRGLVTFHDDGTLDATYAPTRDAGDAGDGPLFRLSEAHGSWEAGDAGSFTATIAALLLDADGIFAGTLTLTVEGRLTEGGDAYAGTVAFAATDADGTEFAVGTGTTGGRRIGGNSGNPAASEPEATPGAAAPSLASPTATGGSATVAIVEFAFDPPELEVVAGTTVTWTNADAAPHSATADDRAWDTGILEAEQSGSVAFDEPGTFPYHCDVHPAMTGTITVRPA